MHTRTDVACWEITSWQCMLGDCHENVYRMIWFLQLPPRDLSGNTMAFSKITSEGTCTLLPVNKKNNNYKQILIFMYKINTCRYMCSGIGQEHNKIHE